MDITKVFGSDGVIAAGKLTTLSILYLLLYCARLGLSQIKIF